MSTLSPLIKSTLVQIRQGKLNTLVNKFMAFSRVMGMVYISTLMLGQVVSTYYRENEVNWRLQKLLP